MFGIDLNRICTRLNGILLEKKDKWWTRDNMTLNFFFSIQIHVKMDW